MSALELRQSEPSGTRASADVDIVVPVYNEAKQLRASVCALRSYLDTSFPFAATITIADNASTDGTWPIARELAETLPDVTALHLDQKGRGRALRAAWSGSTAKVVSYMDVDLATGLDALLPLVEPLLSGQSDLAVGTRLAPGARVVRGTRREFISRGYNLLLRAALRSETTDAQCGFKAMRSEIAALHGTDGRLDAVTLTSGERLPFSVLFLFLGAQPCTDWLGDTVGRDQDGFILTGAAVNADNLLETSVSGVFAAGDARSGSAKRVATAVGEGRTHMELPYISRMAGFSIEMS